ncbi:hypothetical protein SAMN02799631_06350 [Methylobacterium sp. 174MFSha1.1]|uniref:hypothetical protein n=1 Tax=Methylobacterium sp. 174MFSha1.1 TaxID=1502749 RepID=UPI0008E29FD7|nr:hypothetical protein [Methylobacterium sp. 174MFSha1.1]SFV16256.1 hypothetical protein SAMN02799631_06350 [Methylobacterium sp. 174MFSha1.1]
MPTSVFLPFMAEALPLFSQDHDQAEPHRAFLRLDLESGAASLRSEDVLEDDILGRSLYWSITPFATWALLKAFTSQVDPLLAQIIAGHSVKYAGLRLHDSFSTAAVDASDEITRLADTLEAAAPRGCDAVEYVLHYYRSVAFFAQLWDVDPCFSDHDLCAITDQLVVDALDADGVALTNASALYLALCDVRDAMSCTEQVTLDIECQSDQVELTYGFDTDEQACAFAQAVRDHGLV